MDKFAGMTYVDTHPVVVGPLDVRTVAESEIPVPLVEYARESLRPIAGDLWWTLGEFRYAGEDYDTAVGRWTPDGIEFGVEVSL